MSHICETIIEIRNDMNLWSHPLNSMGCNYSPMSKCNKSSVSQLWKWSILQKTVNIITYKCLNHQTYFGSQWGSGWLINLIIVLAIDIQIKVCTYRNMLPRPRLVWQEPELRPIRRIPGVPDKFSRGLCSVYRYSAQILICFIAYISNFLFLCGFAWELCRTTAMQSALCHCPL